MEDIGCLFGLSHQKDLKSIFLSDSISVKLKLIDDDPGHVQSGLYLWPGSTALSTYLIQNWSSLKNNLVIELGAGCGLVGIVSYILQQKQLSQDMPSIPIEQMTVILTDYDLASVQLLQENVELNIINIPNADTNGSSHVLVERLEWGGAPGETVTESLTNCNSILLLGSDLLYCASVVRPLLLTVRSFLNNRSGSFLLTSSFSVGKEIEIEMSQCCEELHIKVVEQTLDSNGNISLSCKLWQFTLL